MKQTKEVKTILKEIDRMIKDLKIARSIWLEGTMMYKQIDEEINDFKSLRSFITKE